MRIDNLDVKSKNRKKRKKMDSPLAVQAEFS
jgi:hypothetical protein